MTRHTSSPASSRIRVEASAHLWDHAWDAFVAGVSEAHIEQSCGWAAIKREQGWSVLRLVAYDDAQAILGGVQVLTKRVGRLGTLAYVIRGPVLSSGHPELERVLAHALDTEGRRRSWLYCVLDYSYRANSFSGLLRSLGYGSHPEGVPPSGLWGATVMLPLSGSEEDMLERTTKNFRRDIRRSQREGLEFGLGTREDLRHFWPLMLATCERRNATPTPAHLSVFQRLWDEYHAKGWVNLFLVRNEGKIICAAFAFTFSDTVRVWKIGWNGEASEKNPNRFMWWRTICWALGAGYRHFDFVWLDYQDALAYAGPEGLKAKFRDGSSYTKLGYGGDVLFLQTPASRFYHPLMFAFNHRLGRKLIESKLVKRVLAKYWSKQ